LALVDEQTIAKAHEEISYSSVELLRREPFFGHLVSGLTRHITTSIDTVAVGLRGDTIQLIVNPLFFTKKLKRKEHRHAVLKHEVLHIVFRHLFRIPTPSHDRFLWNVAADLVVNQYVAPFVLPDGAIRIADFPELFEGQTADQYYSYLETLKKSKKPTPEKLLLENLLSSFPSDHSLWSSSSSSRLDGEPVGSAVSDLVANVLEQAIEEKILRAADHAKKHGVLPNWLEEVVSQIRASRYVKVNWKRVLRLFAASSSHTKIKSTFRKESRRFESVPDLKTFEGLSIKKQQRIVVVVDTSGSIDDNQLDQFFTEIHAIHKNGAHIEILEVDAEVKRTYPYRGKPPKFVLGRGGTDFDPAFRWIRESSARFDGCIYLTDGYAEAPTIKPGCRLLWVLSGGEGGDHLLFGKQVVMET
jgi:predicted metal-dependent peptidase